MASEKRKQQSLNYYYNHQEECKQRMKEYQDKTNYSQNYWESHKEEKREYDKKYYQEHKEIRKEYTKQYYKEKRKDWNKEHSEEISSYMKEWRAKNRKRIKEYKEACFKENYNLLVEQGLITDCIICGFPKEKFAALDFHHINPKEKEKQMSPLMHNTCNEKLIQEAQKCVCLCRNCHSLYHAGDKEIIEKYNKYIKEKEKKDGNTGK